MTSSVSCRVRKGLDLGRRRQAGRGHGEPLLDLDDQQRHERDVGDAGGHGHDDVFDAVTLGRAAVQDGRDGQGAGHQGEGHRAAVQEDHALGVPGLAGVVAQGRQRRHVDRQADDPEAPVGPAGAEGEEEGGPDGPGHRYIDAVEVDGDGQRAGAPGPAPPAAARGAAGRGPSASWPGPAPGTPGPAPPPPAPARRGARAAGPRTGRRSTTPR